MHWRLGEQDMARRAGVIPFAMAPTSGSSPSSKAGGSGVTASTGASIDSPGGIGSSARGRGGFGGPRGGELPPIYQGFTDHHEIGRRDDRGLRRRSEGGRGGRGTTILPSVAELEGGVGVYDDDYYYDDHEEEEEEEEGEEEEEEEEAKIKKEEEEGERRPRKSMM